MLRILPAVFLAFLAFAGDIAAQEAYPTRPVTLVSPYPPGGAADLTARPLAPALEKVLKQPVIVVNRTGAGGAVGTQFVSQAPADGYTLVITVFSICTIPEADRVAGRKPRFTREQFVPIGRINADPTLLIVHPSTPWKTVKQLVADAKKRPNEILYVSAGPYSVAHMSMEIFQQVSGVQMRHLPTNGGGPALTALLGNNSQVLVSSIAAASSQMKAGKARALACFSAKRAASAPDVPTLKELGYDVQFSLWVGLFAPKGTPSPIVQKLREETKKAVASEQFTKAIANIGDVVAYLDQPDFAKFWDEDAKRVEEAVHSIGKV